MPVNLYFIGTAGSGKTTLTREFKLWMDRQGYKSVVINLDPGAERLPYEVDIDIRDWVSIKEVMEEHDLGPNGAQIACADMIAMNALEIKNVMDEYDCHYFLIDTPGQMELFTFRQSSREMVRTLGDRSFITFLFDPVLSKQPTGFVSLLLLAGSSQFRFDVPFFPIISKADMLSKEDIEMIQEWGKNHWELDTALREEGTSETQVALELIKSIQNLGLQREIPAISSAEPSGLEEIYTAVQNSLFGGEDLET
ncbi:MAG: ATP/GTP-binding protein [Candidatus Saliniplasma sp.]